MTVSQLYNSVAQLGFEDSLENDRRFIYAANRALLQVNAIRPATNAYLINHTPLENKADKTGYETIEVTEETYYTAESGKAYYFEVSGNGHLTIEYMKDGAWTACEHDYDLNGNGFKAYRGMIKADGNSISGTVRLKFSGEYLFYIRNVAIYDRLLSADPEDIPAYGKYARYDISALADDFLGLATPPIIEYSSDNSPLKYLSEHYDVENGRVILLLNSIKGLFKVMYNRKPKEIVNKGNISTDDTKIDLDEDLAALLPLLVASYVWLEDEPEKAQYYLSLYNDRAIDIERRKKEATPIKMINVTGW
jgi:hypothetical protein